MSDNSMLKDLIMGSILTGQISEIHLTNMKNYLFVFIDNVEKAEMSYTILTAPPSPDATESLITYTVSFKEDKVPDQLKEGIVNLQKSLAILFGQKNIKVTIRDNYGQVLGSNNGQ